MNYPYESLAYNGRLEFKDAHGLEAYFHCYQRLRVLEPELFTVTQRAWGLGDPFYDFVAPAAKAVYVQTDSDPPAIVLVLKKPAKRGEEVEIHSIRRIHHAFKGDRGAWEYAPFTPTERVRMAINFPLAREASGIFVASTLGASMPFVQRPGTKELRFDISSAMPGSLYRTDWKW